MTKGNWINNKRGGKRFHPVTYYPVNLVGEDRLFAHVGDVSGDGLLLLRDEPLEVDSTYRINVKLDKAFEGRDILALGVQTRWCRQLKGGDRYECGMKIKAVSKADADAIDQLSQMDSFESFTLGMNRKQ